MALDMEELRKMFYEECRENLEVLEGVLLKLDPNEDDLEPINTIFRAAHSIKGGAATFNLFDISEFTHSVEAYLDLVRNEELSLTVSSIDVLLQSVDCIMNMLEGHESGKEVDASLKDSVSKKLHQLLESEPDKPDTPSQVAPPEEKPESTQPSDTESDDWKVTFVPHPEMFFSGNDPLRILREVIDLDESVSITCNRDKLPAITEIEGELSYLSWQATLSGSIEEEQIREIFEWVEDECDLHIERIKTHDAILETESQSNKSVDIPDNGNTATAEVTQDASKQAATEKGTERKTPKNEVADSNTKVAKSEPSVSSIRVDIDKVDGLINLVGELVITQSMLAEIGNDFTIDKLEKLKAGLDQLLQNSKDLQENVLNIRMLPMSFAFSRFPRLVRDLCGRLEKQVDLQIKGENTELDKTVLERIVDPLVHLVRNGIDHGIEVPQVRLENGKPELGTIELNAFHQGGSIIIEIIDDGAGINCDKLWEKALEKGLFRLMHAVKKCQISRS